MDLLKKELVLEEVPLFSGLSDAERLFIKERASLKEYKKGQVIYAEGSCADAFYCLLLGRVEIYTQGAGGQKTTLEYLHRGKYFGIISLLTGEPHSVSAYALNDCLILCIKKEDFDSLLEKAPKLAIDLSRTLSRRLKRKDIHQKTIFESMIISVFSSYAQAGKTTYTLNLALSLKKETHKKVVVLDIAPADKIHSLPQRLGITEYRALDLSTIQAANAAAAGDFILHDIFGIDLVCLHYKTEEEACVGRLMNILSLLVNDYHYLILDLPALMDRPVFEILNQSDIIQILSSPDEVDLERTHNLIQRLKGLNFYAEKIKVIINEYKLSKLTHAEQVKILTQEVFATLPGIDFISSDRLVLDNPQGEYAKAVRRIARTLGECLVGLVLGVGVGYGFCHIGVLKVMEEEKIPIDVIAGSSIGAVIACLWATGNSSAQILQITKEFREPQHIWGLIDLTFPFLGFIKGNKLKKFLKKHLGTKTFYDTRLPLKIVASDVRRKEPKVFDKGLLVDALMASCAMPGVFAPFKFKGDILFDGGVINPLPTEALFKAGVKKIIAVNVTPSRQDVMRQYEKLKGKASEPSKGNLKGRVKTNILDIIFSSIELLQSEVANREGELADIVLHPDTSGLYWLELHRAEEFARRGEEEARRNLERIRKVINE